MKKVQSKYKVKTGAHETVATQCNGEDINNTLNSRNHIPI